MSVRETLQKSKPLVIATASIAVMAALWVSYNQATGGIPVPSEAYYSTDEGKTWFGGPLTEAPPFQKNGKEAVRVVLYECDGKQFVGYLEKLDERSKAIVEKFIKARDAGEPTDGLAMSAQNAMANGWVRRLPGETEWGHRSPAFDPEIKCPGEDRRAKRAMLK